MNRTNEFAKDLCRELERHKMNGINWECAGPKGVKGGRESVDATGYRKDKTPFVLVEVELRRVAPVSNVVKVWSWIEHKRFRNKLILIQAFSARYSKKDTRRNNAIFIGERMESAGIAKYVPLDFDYRPRKYGKVGAGRRRHHATQLARQIVRHLRP